MDNISNWDAETQKYVNTLRGRLYAAMDKAMYEGKWMTYRDMCEAIGGSNENSVSAAMRALRQKPFLKTILRRKNKDGNQKYAYQFMIMCDSTIYWEDENDVIEQQRPVEMPTVTTAHKPSVDDLFQEFVQKQK